jgi:hypothetical protein
MSKSADPHSDDLLNRLSPRLPRWVRFMELSEIGLALFLGIMFKIYYDYFVVDWDLALSSETELVLSFHYWVSLGLFCFALHEALVWYPPTRDSGYLHSAVMGLECLGVIFGVAEAMLPLSEGGLTRLT